MSQKILSTLTRADGTQVVQQWPVPESLNDTINLVEGLFLRIMMPGEILTLESTTGGEA